MNRYQGPLRNPLSLVLLDGTTFRLTEAEVSLSVSTTPDALELVLPRIRVCGAVPEWDAALAATIRVEWSGGLLALGLLRPRACDRTAAGVESFSLDLILDRCDEALLRRLSEPVRPLPLSTDELATLVEATRDDDPTGLIPRLLATVAAERERGDQRGKTLAKIIQADDEGGVSRAIGRVLDRQAETAATTRPRGTMG